MVAVLRAELEQVEADEGDLVGGRHLRLVDGGAGDHGALTHGAKHRQSSATYWRRRIVCLVIAAGLLWALVGAAEPLIGDSSREQSLEVQTVFESAAGQSLTAGQVVIVKPGDTLWSIARKLQPTGDIRPLVDRIAKINNGHSLMAGQTLVLP